MIIIFVYIKCFRICCLVGHLITFSTLFKNVLLHKETTYVKLYSFIQLFATHRIVFPRKTTIYVLHFKQLQFSKIHVTYFFLRKVDFGSSSCQTFFLFKKIGTSFKSYKDLINLQIIIFLKSLSWSIYNFFSEFSVKKIN